MQKQFLPYTKQVLFHENPNMIPMPNSSSSVFVSSPQVGIIDVEIVYSDQTTMPLKFVSPEHFFLEVMSEDPNIVGVALSDGPAYQPKVIAEGKCNTLY